MSEPVRDDAPLRIVYVSPDLPPAPFATGIGTYTQAMARIMAERGHDVRIVTRAHDRESVAGDEAGVPVHRVGPPRVPFPESLDAAGLATLVARGASVEIRYRARLARTLDGLVRSGAAEVIEAADAQAEAVMYRSIRHPHVPFIVRLHGPLAAGERFDQHVPGFVRRAIGAYERFHYRRASYLSVPSARSGTLFREWLSLGARPIRAIANPPPRTPPDRAGTEVDGEVLFVGRLVPMKGVDLLLAAVPAILERHPHATFTLLGADHTADVRAGAARERLLASLPAAARDRVTIAGKVPMDEVWARYDRATVVALPSRFDTFSYTCLEAMARGKPVVGSTVGGMADLLDEGRAGLLFDPPDVDALARQVSRLLADPELRRTLGERARRRFEDNYARDVVAADMERFYRDALRDAR